MTTPTITIAVPRIGTFWKEQGGIYAGIVAGENGQPDYHLILADAEHEIIDVTFQEAIRSAKRNINGFSDWSAPTSNEAKILAINCRYSFNLDGWYWTGTEDSHDQYAWAQEFDEGEQYTHRKSNYFRARQVRRVPITEAV